MASICRDCAYQDAQSDFVLCPFCRSKRTVSHPELTALSIAHVDCDAFFAMVEKRDHPELADRPVIVGGGNRGVVSTCCYIARASGVKSAMPMFQARQLCPQAEFIRPRMAVYAEVSKQIRKELERLTPDVEPLSIDEAFLDLSGTQRLHRASPARSLARLALSIEEKIGLTISIGLSHNKFLAKIASDIDKPRGMVVIGKRDTMDFLADKPVTIIYGIGKNFGERLQEDGITKIGQLQTMRREDLAARYGETGIRLYDLARGNDTRKVTARQRRKSVSREITFDNNINDLKKLSYILRLLCEDVGTRLKRTQTAGNTITLKLKSARFTIRTRRRRLLAPSQLTHTIYETALDMLKKEVGRTSFRLLGVGVTDLVEAPHTDPVDLVEPQIAREAAVERAMDSIRDRYGKQAVLRGKFLRGKNEHG